MAAGLAAALAVSGCSSSKPHPPDLRVMAKKKKPQTAEDAAAEDEFGEAPALGGPGTRRSRNLPLAGTKWAWEGNLIRDGFELAGGSSAYSLEFKPNGWFDFQADCQHGIGIYEANGQRIALAVVKTGRAGCRHAPQAEEFLRTLETAKQFRKADDKLYLELKRDAKTMVFGLLP